MYLLYQLYTNIPLYFVAVSLNNMQQFRCPFRLQQTARLMFWGNANNESKPSILDRQLECLVSTFATGKMQLLLGQPRVQNCNTARVLDLAARLLPHHRKLLANQPFHDFTANAFFQIIYKLLNNTGPNSHP